ncbi:MAG: choice-of-anchor K domain-containing protein [Verrucomicrobiae bacterium]|nr:choice-of-anchor K domain-containing protein [Verrucomicrobiae bacterium]
MKVMQWAIPPGTVTCLICLLLAIPVIRAAADEVEFPAGAASFADRVVLVESDGDPSGAEALGVPDELAFELGDGGRLVVQFVDNVLVPGGDEKPDLGIITLEEPPAPLVVAVSRDGILWEPLGTLQAGDSGIDLEAFGYGRDDRFRFVEMVDIAGDGTAVAIDAVGAISSANPSGGVSAVFQNPQGGGGMVVTGVGTATFGWGEATGTPFANSLEFRAGEYTGGVEMEFDLGTLTYFNGTTANGTTADKVFFTVTLDTGGEDEAFTFEFPLELQSTVNGGNAFQNADIVRLPNPFSDAEIMVQGRGYHLRLWFEAVTAGGFTEVDRFFALEGQGVSAVLRGKLTAESALDGCVPRRLTFDYDDETVPAWNPAGGTIAFATNRDFGRDIGGIADDRTRERLLATGISSNGGGLVANLLSWLGSSGGLVTTESVNVHEVLVFDTAREPGERELADESEDSAEFSRLLKFTSIGGFFVVSRDGLTALWKDWDGVRSTLRTAGIPILRGQVASEIGAVLRDYPGSANRSVLHSAALSPDGDFVVLSEAVNDHGGHDLLRLSTGGGDEPEVLITSGMGAGEVSRYPSVSPDGRHVAFASSDSAGMPGDIYVLALATGEVWNVTMTEDIDETQPDWSPDGGSLVYSRFDTANSPELRSNEQPNWNLYVQCLEKLNDRDDDGVADLLEEAFGSDPNHPDQTSLPIAVVETIDGFTRAGVSFTVPVNGAQVGSGVWRAGGFEYAVESSIDLKHWERGVIRPLMFKRGPIDTMAGSGREQLNVLLVEPVDALQGAYLRVAVMREP